MTTSAFEFFFKYKPIVYQKGKLAFQLVGSKWWFLPVAVLCVVAAYYFYRSIARDKWSPGLVGLRGLTFAVLAFMFLRPVLNVATVLPQDSYLAVLIDNSASMKIRDEGEKTRAEEMLKQFEDTNFFKRLSDKFKVRIYRFDKDAERIERLDRLTFEGKRTSLESGTDVLRQDLSTAPLSGVVLLTDAVDNGSQQFKESLAKLESRNIPFLTVGVGAEKIDGDAEIIKVDAPREVLMDSTASIDVSYRSHGFAGRKATLRVMENATTVVTAKEITLPADGVIAEYTVDVPVKNEGDRIFSFTLQTTNDRIAENNTLDALVTVRNDHPKILYVEGEPRWEFKFIRRAVEDDKNLHLVTLLRSSTNKYYRQGIENEKELADGFPKTKEELYGYKGVIFGSIESTFFTQDQLKMVSDYVNNRGGGFMMIGGRNSFSGGKYQNTPIADILPVTLGGDKAPVIDHVKMAISDYGQTNPLMRLTPDATANMKHWSDLPPLADFNRTVDPKVGAVVLARGHGEKTGENPILLAFQRYGRGRTMAFTTGSSWRWQMEMDAKDQTFEVFWKQLLRWLVNSSPDQVTVTSDKDTYLPGEPIVVTAEVADKSFERLNNARVMMKLTDPKGRVETRSLDWGGSEDGAYQAQLNATDEGLYQIEVEASAGDKKVGVYRSAFQVKDRPVEFYNASLDAGKLRTIAEQTGGRYYPLADLGDVPDDAQYIPGKSSFVEQKELWDVPFLFMLLTASFGGEWLWRKKVGLA
ncbi:MAG TPA: glutamine amidotransferase [Terriglobia bacterium]|nr:glutamine amidotransferase [Terriglobia bacterium]